MSGTFGRRFKLLIIPPDKEKLSSINDSVSNGSFDPKSGGMEIKTALFDPKLKTGYGTTKILEAMLKKSSALDRYNQPYRLILYNPALNHTFLVKKTGFQLTQDEKASNMMWNYSLGLTAIAPMDRVLNTEETSLLQITSLSILQGGLSSLINNIKIA